MTQAATVRKMPKKIRAGNLAMPGTRARSWDVFVEAGHEPEDLLDPAYWGPVANKLIAGDRIFALSQDFLWAVELIVTAVTPTWASVTMLGKPHLLQKNAKTEPKYEDLFDIVNVAGVGFRVLRKADNQVIADELRDKAAARAAIESYLKTTGRG